MTDISKLKVDAATKTKVSEYCKGVAAVYHLADSTLLAEEVRVAEASLSEAMKEVKKCWLDFLNTENIEVQARQGSQVCCNSCLCNEELLLEDRCRAVAHEGRQNGDS